VITDYELYFSAGRDWVDAFKVWQGGLGIWGAIALGAVGAWIGCRRRGIPLPAYADAIAPGIALAQAIGRWGNWFNQELYGKETNVPWALHITSSADGRVPGYYHPTFLYESLWCIGVAFLVIWADRRFKLGHGRAFALYVAAYCVGRAWIEYMRVDDAHHILGLRLNDWTALIVFLLAVTYMVVSAKKRPGRETVVEPGAAEDEAEADGESTEKDQADSSESKSESGTKQDAEDSADEAPAEEEADEAGGKAKGEAESAKKS
jgi:prolipoprotein diacylglyceryl transferase